MTFVRKLAVLAAIVGVSASLAATASAAPPSPAQVTAAVAACLSHANCAAALTRASAAIGACGRDARCSAAVLRFLSALPAPWRNAILADIRAAIAASGNHGDLDWLVGGGSEAT